MLNASATHMSARRPSRVRLSSVPIRALFFVAAASAAASDASMPVLLSTLILPYLRNAVSCLLFPGVRRRALPLKWSDATLSR